MQLVSRWHGSALVRSIDYCIRTFLSTILSILASFRRRPARFSNIQTHSLHGALVWPGSSDANAALLLENANLFIYKIQLL